MVATMQAQATLSKRESLQASWLCRHGQHSTCKHNGLSSILIAARQTVTPLVETQRHAGVFSGAPWAERPHGHMDLQLC